MDEKQTTIFRTSFKNFSQTEYSDFRIQNIIEDSYLLYIIKIFYYLVIKGELKIVSKVNVSAPDDQTSCVWRKHHSRSFDIMWP